MLQEELVQQLSLFSFNQVFLAVDRLSREGQVQLSRHATYGYRIARRGCDA